MADQLVAATIEVLLDKVVSVAADRINLVLGFRKDLEAMQEHAKDIQAVLADAETKQSRNPIVLRWLHKVEAAAVEADNVLDELLYEGLRRKVESRNKAKRAGKVCLFFSLSKHDLSFRWRMSSKVREINEMFKNFILEVPGIGLIRMEDAMAKAVAGRETNSLPLQFVVGRDKEVSEIVGKLLSASTEASASVSVISIVGMGGLGKTALAKSIYNNPGIDSHFGQKIWACVSDKFEVTELFRLILESLIGGKVEKSSQDGIVRKIQEKLAGKRFLLVLDDVWNDNRMLWNDFFTSLVGLNNASGSCCLVTTRLQKTAKLVSTVDPYVLPRLADDYCWNIICWKATKDGEIPQELDVYREQILEKCQGLPLAANVVGGLLSLQKRDDWVSIVENKILKVSSKDVEGVITPILQLSFDNLPSLPIKKCFAYCSIYPKDAEIRGMELIKLWMAEGFLQKAFLQEGVESRTLMEEIGEDHLTVLLQSSLLERVEDFYKMHDLVHDLAQSVSKREKIDGEVRHLALDSDCIEYNARSTLVRMVKGEISDKVLLESQRLRLLNLCGLKIEKFPNAIGKAKHLRYLDISSSEIKVLPDSLCKLYNLQTLKLDDCWSLQCLPPRFSNLISLRHLHFYPRDMKMPPNMGRLTCLQTLEFFNIGEEKGHEIKELGSMKNLAGKIRIRNLELVKGKEGAGLANLFEKKKLVGLRLSWGSTDHGDNGNRNDEHVLEGLEPHPKLQRLRLENYMGARLPQWFGQLKALAKLEFFNCKTFKDLPTLGHLPYLEYLHIQGLDGVTYIGESFYVEGLWEGKMFPSLKTMWLQNLPNLKEWKGLEAANGHVFPKLESLFIYDCCQLASVPSPFPSLEQLRIGGNIQVSVVRDIIGKSASLLKTLEIESMGGLNSLPHVIENHLTCLEYLGIYNCDNLRDISTIEFCASLVTLSVDGCPKVMPWALNLQRIPSLSSMSLWRSSMFSTNVMPTGFHYLTNLMDLGLGPFTDDSIQSFDWSGLIACSSTLNRLNWDGSLQKHSGLPQQLQHLTSLQFLQLISLNSVEALPDWLGNLTSLRELQVCDCPILRCLPSAHAMRCLTNLRDLRIRNCPLLTESSVQEISSTLPNLKILRR